MLESLHNAVSAHQGEFSCVQIRQEKNTRIVPFRHAVSPPILTADLPPVPGLQAFYATFGSLTLYLDDQSGEAAYHIAAPSAWPALDEDFRPWLDGLTDEEAAECLPDWIDGCMVVGEVPYSGNYLLVPATGPEAGRVFEFEHDGFEFHELGETLPDFVNRALDLDARRLIAIASHLRFVVGDPGCQWWIRELRDNRGNVVRTEL